MNATIINWKTTKAEAELIGKITNRAYEIAKKYGVLDYSGRDINMDITATHCNGCKLDLNKLLGFPDFDFSHDVFGIRRHINRETGQLENCFSPRCSV